MSGFITSGLPALGLFSGAEKLNADTQQADGANPQSEAIALYKLALVQGVLSNALSKTMVAGTIYYSQFEVGAIYTPTPSGAPINQNSYSVTGINVQVGTPGGTDTWHVGIWNSAGVLVARSITAGVTAGTALTIQQIPLYFPDGSTLGPVTLESGSYYLGIQSNGTTAKFLDINSPIWPLATGSQAGAAGTLPAITAPSTTFTVDLGPRLSLY